MAKSAAESFDLMWPPACATEMARALVAIFNQQNTAAVKAGVSKSVFGRAFNGGSVDADNYAAIRGVLESAVVLPWSYGCNETLIDERNVVRSFVFDGAAASEKLVQAVLNGFHALKFANSESEASTAARLYATRRAIYTLLPLITQRKYADPVLQSLLGNFALEENCLVEELGRAIDKDLELTSSEDLYDGLLSVEKKRGLHLLRFLSFVSKNSLLMNDKTVKIETKIETAGELMSRYDFVGSARETAKFTGSGDYAVQYTPWICLMLTSNWLQLRDQSTSLFGAFPLLAKDGKKPTQFGKIALGDTDHLPGLAHVLFSSGAELDNVRQDLRIYLSNYAPRGFKELIEILEPAVRSNRSYLEMVDIINKYKGETS